MDLQQQMQALARAARAAARPVARAPAHLRTQAIEALATGLQAHQPQIEAANAQDLQQARQAGLSPALVDRIDLQGKRLQALAQAMRDIAAQDDPVGAITAEWTRPNGLKVAKMRLPLGVILMIYESRPNVTLDAAALCLRSGNAAIFRGGSEAVRTNAALSQVVQEALQQANLPAAAIQVVPTQAREAIDILLTCDNDIDLVIPRGGEALIRRVVQQSRIPVVRHYKGVCHVYVDAEADLAVAQAIALNAKTHRPGVCNAMETLLVHQAVGKSFLPRCLQAMQQAHVEIRGCERTRALVPGLQAATEADWDTEYLDLILAVRIVDDLDAAMAHIDAHSTQHTASIVSRNPEAWRRFTAGVDASCVILNASTRFNDGGELGLGAEMGISTTRIHAYGPMGATSLTAEKYVLEGSGQVRR